MWPWDHAVFGYVVYSVITHLRGHRPGEEILLVLAGTQVPDLVDKPLSWVFHVFESGYAVGHSALVAAPAGALVIVLAARRGRLRSGIAVVIGYWSHLLGDVVWASVLQGSVSVSRVLWPLRPTGGGAPDLLARLESSLQLFAELFTSPGSRFALVAYLSLFAVGGSLWLLDGYPGTATLARLRRVVSRASE